MTIKDLEKQLQIPRATIRFYEKEGLITPERLDNGYREYSEEDIKIIKQIIVFRKIGISVSDIKSMFDGEKNMEEVLSVNMLDLENKIKELKGAMNICKKMQDNHEQIETFDEDKYLYEIEEEERKGNLFIDIAKDIAIAEKKMLIKHFGLDDAEGNLGRSIFESIVVVAISFFAIAIFDGLITGNFGVSNLKETIKFFISVLIADAVVTIPVFFLERKWKWAREHQLKCYVLVCLVLAALILLIGALFV